MLKIRGRKLLFLLSRRGAKWETGVDFENVTWALPRGDKVWRGNQWPALSSRNLYFCINLCKYFFGVKILSFLLMELSWNRGCLLFFFNKLWSWLTFHGNRPADYPPLKDQDGQESEGAPLCQQPLPRERTHVLPLFQLKFGGTRCEDVSVGAVFKRISFTQTSLRVTLALLISEGLKGPMS